MNAKRIPPQLVWAVALGLWTIVLPDPVDAAVTAVRSPKSGVLTIRGDGDDDIIHVSRAGILIRVNFGDVAVVGGPALVTNVSKIIVRGGRGEDEIEIDDAGGGLPPAFVRGGGDNDTIVGSNGDDDLRGGSGNDLILGRDGDDNLLGNGGNDTLIGQNGADRMIGGSGQDLAVWNNGDDTDEVDGGGGDDTLQVNGADGAGDDFLIRTAPKNRIVLQRNNLGLFRVEMRRIEDLDVNGQGGDDRIAGSEGLDGKVELDIDGGEGNDLLIGGDGADVLRAGRGRDTILGRAGNDIALGEDGDDLFVWNEGDGDDLIFGGGDDDTLQVNGSNDDNDDFSITPNGDRVSVARTAPSVVQLDVSVETLDLNLQGGHDVARGSVGLRGLIHLDVDGGAGNDEIEGGDGVDTLRGGDGDDVLLGHDDIDILLGEDGNDRLEGGEGADLLFGMDEADVLIGGRDDDTLQGGDGEDTLSGGSGDDDLFGEAGNDTLDGGTGTDLLDGGLGTDTGVNGEVLVSIP